MKRIKFWYHCGTFTHKFITWHTCNQAVFGYYCLLNSAACFIASRVQTGAEVQVCCYALRLWMTQTYWNRANIRRRLAKPFTLESFFPWPPPVATVLPLLEELDKPKIIKPHHNKQEITTYLLNCRQKSRVSTLGASAMRRKLIESAGLTSYSGDGNFPILDSTATTAQQHWMTGPHSCSETIGDSFTSRNCVVFFWNLLQCALRKDVITKSDSIRFNLVQIGLIFRLVFMVFGGV